MRCTLAGGAGVTLACRVAGDRGLGGERLGGQQDRLERAATPLDLDDDRLTKENSRGPDGFWRFVSRGYGGADDPGRLLVSTASKPLPSVAVKGHVGS